MSDTTRMPEGQDRTGALAVALADAPSELATNGYTVVPDVLDADEVAHAVERLWAARDESERRGMRTFIPGLDPNASNVRVFNLLDLDPVFRQLIAHPVADALVAGLLGADYIVSNFTANIARPGSRSMMIHSDQSLVAPEPWLTPWSINIIWCLCDLRADNGATLFAPGTHRITQRADLPDDLAELGAQMVPFEAPAGAVVAMDGRLWHTSGANITIDEDRPLLFGYYTRPFVRPQWNHPVALRPEVQAELDPVMRTRLGLDIALNIGRG
jgi:ectoine hydroxylase-related dioxygenase (phytanoyl-CoA dioxygenase family)